MAYTIDPRRSRAYPEGYGLVYPVADYRPWDTDTVFQNLFRRIREHTKLDVFRCYELWKLAGHVSNRSGDILEVGVWRGGSAALMAHGAADRKDSRENVRENEAGPEPMIWLADTFCGVVKAGSRDPYYRGGEHADTTVATVRGLMDSVCPLEYRVLEGIFPDETAAAIEDRRFSLVHVDVDVYLSARDITNWVWPRLIPGGVIVYDDYGFYGCEGVTALVHELEYQTDLVSIRNLNGQAVFVKVR
jgi:O-methyltransferase